MLAVGTEVVGTVVAVVGVAAAAAVEVVVVVAAEVVAGSPRTSLCSESDQELLTCYPV